MATVQRTTGGLREALFQELDSLRAGETSPSRARAVSGLSNSIIQSVTAEIELKKSVGQVSPEVGSLALTVERQGEL